MATHLPCEIEDSVVLACDMPSRKVPRMILWMIIKYLCFIHIHIKTVLSCRIIYGDVVSVNSVRTFQC